MAVGVVVFSLKFVAWRITDSTALLSDALESVVNIAAAVLLIVSLRVARRPADRDHPYGHGRIEFFSAGVEGALIVVAALLIAYEAAHGLVEGRQLAELDKGLALVLFASLLNGLVGVWLVRLGKREHSLALEADGRHLLTDVVTSAGVLAGLAAVWLTEFWWLDSALALLVAAHILRTGFRLVRRSFGALMDEADPVLLDRVTSAFGSARRPWWIDAHGLRVWRSGSQVHGDLHLVVPRFYDADRLHEIGDEVESAFALGAEAPSDLLVHFDPCRPHYCAHCSLPDCAVRERDFEGEIEMNRARVTSDGTP